jgi:hypothetical protein
MSMLREGRSRTKDFEQERTEKTERKSFAENALFLNVALQRRHELSIPKSANSED